MSLKDTLGDEEWLEKNEKAIREMLPTTWTHINNLNGLQLGYKWYWPRKPKLSPLGIILCAWVMILMAIATVMVLWTT